MYGEVRGLAYGGYGEGSTDVHSLMDAAATHLARTTWRWAGVRTLEEMRNTLITRYRRRVGVRVVKAFAAYRLERVPFIGMPRHMVEAIRDERRQPPQPVDPYGATFRAMDDAEAVRQMRGGGPRR